MRPQRRPPMSSMQSMKRPSERSTRPSRINEKPYSRPMAMDYEDAMEWEETSRYSPTPVHKVIWFRCRFFVTYFQCFTDRQTNYG